MKDLDIYYNKDYGELCCFIEPGECIEFECKTINGKIRNMFIKRPVPWTINGIQYYDAVTPYGYGGPIICESNNISALVNDYEQQFKEYLLDIILFIEIGSRSQVYMKMYTQDIQ